MIVTFATKVGSAPATTTLHFGEGLDANEVIPRLWQGAAPPAGKLDFDVLVLAADSNQPPASDFPGVKIIRVPLNDPTNQFYKAEQAPAVQAALQVAQAYLTGDRILVTCQRGWNRSGLIVALALQFLGVDANRSIDLVRAARGADALSNTAFADFVRAFRPTVLTAPPTDKTKLPKLLTLLGGAILAAAAFCWGVGRR